MDEDADYIPLRNLPSSGLIVEYTNTSTAFADHVLEACKGEQEHVVILGSGGLLRSTIDNTQDIIDVLYGYIAELEMEEYGSDY